MVRTRARLGETCCKEILSEVLVGGGEVEPKDVSLGAQVRERLDHLFDDATAHTGQPC